MNTYQNTAEKQWLWVTLFPDRWAKSKEDWEYTLADLANEIRTTQRADKDHLPWLKLARFGDQRTKKGCLRSNANVLAVSGVEAEHDAGTMSFDEALTALQKARVHCLIYTSPSYQKGLKERWRVLAPFSKEYPPTQRTELVAAINGVLDGAVTGESFTLSTAFYYGRVGDNPDHRVEIVEGDYLDLRPDLYVARRYKNQTAKTERARQGPAPAAKPVNADEVVAALAVIPADCSYEIWRNVAAALRHQFGDDGFALFNDWSIRADGKLNKQGAEVYTREGTEQQWNAAATMTEITIGTIFHHANRIDPTWRARYSATVAERVAAGLTALAAAPDEAPPKPAHDAAWDDQIGWLLLTHGYCAPDDKVVEIYAAGNNCQLGREAFKFAFQAWYKVVRENGRDKVVRAPSAWGVHPHRVAVRGVRMRPDMPFPLYTERAEQYKNTYRRPRHAATGGNMSPFVIFMERFLPDPTEREWLFDWMAHKQARPDVPGTAVIFVADNEDGVREGRFGTGRGLMFRIVHQLYGEQYARTQSFNVLDGTSGQSVYTDWIHGSVLVTVDESRTSPTAHRKGERSAVYDVLKDIVDPNPKQMNFKVKHRQAFDAMSYCSFWVATNHADAVAIPSKDRRFTVLRNGREITTAEAIEIDAWMRDPANIGALSCWLAERDLSTFNMRQPLDTIGKADMADLARSEVDDILTDFMEDDRRGLVFTRQQLLTHVGHNFSDRQVRWHGDFEGAWNRYCVRLAGLNGGPRRIRVGGIQKKLFCFRSRRAEVERLPEASLPREAVKWGHVDHVETPFSVLTQKGGLTEKDEDNQ